MSACGHTRHVGTCPECQRVQLARWRTQLIAASDAARPAANPASWAVESASRRDLARGRGVTRLAS
jgi:hypothetical protein